MSYTPWKRFNIGSDYNYEIVDEDERLVADTISAEVTDSIIRDHNVAPLLLEALEMIGDVLAAKSTTVTPEWVQNVFDKYGQQAIKEATQ